MAVAEAIIAAQPTLLDEAAAEAAATARYLGERAGEDVLAKGTAGIYALAVRRRALLGAKNPRPFAALRQWQRTSGAAGNGGSIIH